MRELYADFNNFDSDGQMPLHYKGSVKSISLLKEALKDGEEAWLSDGELRVKANVFLCDDGVWVARSSNWNFEDKPTL